MIFIVLKISPCNSWPKFPPVEDSPIVESDEMGMKLDDFLPLTHFVFGYA